MNEETINPHMPSNRNQLAALDIGETLARATQVQPEELDSLNEMKLTYRRTWSSAIARAKALTGYEFLMETTETITTSGNIFVLMVITRTA